MSISRDYLLELNDAYEDWIHQSATSFRTATLDTGHGQDLNADQVLDQCLRLLKIKLQLEIPLGNEPIYHS